MEIGSKSKSSPAMRAPRPSQGVLVLSPYSKIVVAALGLATLGLWTLGGVGSVGRAAPLGFAQPAFEATWRHTDAPVAAGSVKRTWFWGPQPNTGGLME